VLYTDGPTDGTPDDLKKIKGIGPKFESDLNAKGVYYFRQIAAWKAKDIRDVEAIMDKFPGRIARDGWVKQAKSLTKASS
jgi:NADH-quinone oxidoreductase subunit E